VILVALGRRDWRRSGATTSHASSWSRPLPETSLIGLFRKRPLQLLEHVLFALSPSALPQDLAHGFSGGGVVCGVANRLRPTISEGLVHLPNQLQHFQMETGIN